MFNRDLWSEIFMALRRNKLRTILTGFSISWGIFMLIILLGAGNGLMNGISNNFKDRALNVYSVYSSMTSLPYKGHKANRWIQLSDKDIRLLENNFPHIDKVSPLLSQNGTASFNEKTRSTSMSGVKPIYEKIRGLKILEGRFLNENDENNSEKVIVIDKAMSNDLFKEKKSAVGQFVIINGIAYKVIGVWKGYRESGGSTCFLPYSTLKKIFREEYYWQLSFTTYGLDTKEQNEEFNSYIREKFLSLHEISPDDTRGIFVESSMLESIETNNIFSTISLFIWIIGIAMLISGIVGVSNIMRITVKERTNEIGIRKALGARSSSILVSIVMESLLITTIFGYIGMMAGIGLTEAINYFLEKSEIAGTGDMSVFTNPTVDVKIVVLATMVLIVSGIIAGFFPARNAVKVKPIEAITYR